MDRSPVDSLRNHRGLVLAAAILLLALGAWGLHAYRTRGAGADEAAPVTVGVIAYRVEPKPFVDALEALGTLSADESIKVTTKVSDVVTGIEFREGQQVRAGQVLVRLQDAEAQANLAVAQAALVESRNAYERGQEVARQKLISQSQLDQLEAKMRADEARVHAAESQLADHTIRAPFAGRVGLRHVSLGALVTPGAEITTLDDTANMKLDFSVPEAFLASVHEGLEITARSSAYPDTEFHGKVSTIDTRIDTTTRAFAVRARLPNTGDLLKPGMFLTVRLIRGRSEVLLVPEAALVPEQERQFVFVVADGVVHKREVHIGRRQPGVVEVLDGVRAGDQVVVEGTQKVRDGGAARVEELRT